MCKQNGALPSTTKHEIKGRWGEGWETTAPYHEGWRQSAGVQQEVADVAEQGVTCCFSKEGN